MIKEINKIISYKIFKNQKENFIETIKSKTKFETKKWLKLYELFSGFNILI